MEAEERTFKEHMAQLRRKLQGKREWLLREQNMMLQHKLKVDLHGLRVPSSPGTPRWGGEVYTQIVQGSTIIICWL
jgi:hypothetical protein